MERQVHLHICNATYPLVNPKPTVNSWISNMGGLIQLRVHFSRKLTAEAQGAYKGRVVICFVTVITENNQVHIFSMLIQDQRDAWQNCLLPVYDAELLTFFKNKTLCQILC